MKPATLSPLERAGLILAALLIGLVYFFPLWRISLQAPQYPEGLSLFIWSDKLSGDLRTINTLNHYIGMAAIHPESFTELKYFTPVFFGLAIGAVVAAAVGRKILLYLWTLLLVGFSGWALVDFWLWEFKFGHELDPDAAIKMEDMVYQPPLIGEKDFLNITASSWPDVAGAAFACAVALAVLMSILALLRSRRQQRRDA